MLPLPLVLLHPWAGQLRPRRRPTPHADATNNVIVRHETTASEKTDYRREDVADREALRCHDGADAL